MPPALFALVIFQIGSCIFAWGWPQTSIFSPTQVSEHMWDHRCALSHLAIDWDGVNNFCLGCPQILILLISASWVVGITGGTTVPSSNY
jgi:hypothetical protein